MRTIYAVCIIKNITEEYINMPTQFLDDFQFTGKTVIVTGGNGGIGQGIVQAFVERGADVVIADRAPAVAALKFEGAGTILDIPTDITDRSSVDNMVAQTIDEFKTIDVLINNAGAGKGQARIMDVTPEDIDWLIQLNIYGTLNCTQSVVKVMSEQGSGSIVNISSGAALSGFSGRYDPVYAGCKGFINSLTKVLAADLGESNVRVNTIAPGWIVPETNEQISEGSFWQTLKDQFGTPESFNADYNRTGTLHASSTALPQLGRPRDIANAAVYFASDAGRHSTGQILSICGGAYMPS